MERVRFVLKVLSMIRSGKRKRVGIAATEAAICIPLIVLITFGTLEVCAAIFLKETVTIAAYEGARVGVKKGATATDVRNKVTTVLQARGITPLNPSDLQITVTPSSFSNMDALDPVTVEVEMPVAGYVAYINGFFASNRVKAKVAMAREFDN